MFTFTHGLFKFDYTDYHAILGVSLDAEFAEVRKRYMRLARRLHPVSYTHLRAHETI